MLIQATHVTLLLRCLDERGIIRIPSDHPTPSDQTFFGLTTQIDPRQPISKQLVTYAAAHIGRPQLSTHIEVLTIVDPPIERPGAEPSLLYLMKIDPSVFIADSSWPTLVSALKLMPPGKMRRAYNKAFQFFAGAADAKVDVLELDQEVQHRLAEIMGGKPPPLLE